MKTTPNTFLKVCMVSRCASAVSLYFFIISTHIDERCLGYVFSTSYTVDGNTTKKQHVIDTVSPIPLVIFVISRSLKFACQNIGFSNLIQAITFTFFTRLPVILKFPYLICYGVLITKQFSWQAGLLNVKKICAYARENNIKITILLS